MSPELVAIEYKCIIHYLGGQKKKFEELRRAALAEYHKEFGAKECPRCGTKMVFGKIGNKYYKESVHLCTSCGLVVGKSVENVRRYKAC